MAEVPAAMYVIFFGMLIPLIALATFGYRVSAIYFAVRDTCYKAGKSSTFSTAPDDAIDNAATAWANDTAAWNGISGTQQIFIVSQPIAGGAETVYSQKLPSPPNTQTNMYFIRLIANCQIQPFFPSGGGWMGLNIPGLTATYPLVMNYQYYVENTAGLTQ